MTCYRADNINPPLNDEISDFFSRGFNIFQISQNVRLGVLIFSMLWPFLDHFALKNSLKKAQNFSRASRANFFSGVLIFSKIQDFFRGGGFVEGRGFNIIPPVADAVSNEPSDQSYVGMMRWVIEFIYFIMYRFIGGIPIQVQNLLPVIFNVKLKNYFFGSLLGFLPQAFVFCSLGSGLENQIKKNIETPSFFELITSFEIYGPIIAFFVLLTFVFLLRKIFYKN